MPAVVEAKTEIWEDDRLGRKSDAEFLMRFLINRVEERREAGQSSSYVLNIDARWGQGKSFFLDRFGKMLRASGHLVAEVNAWKDDFADDPLLSVMDGIDQAVSSFVKKEEKARDRWNAVKRATGAIVVAAAKGATSQVARKIIGEGLEEVKGIIADVGFTIDADKAAEDAAKSLGEAVSKQGQALLETFREGKRTIESFRASVCEFLKTADGDGRKLPLFVLIDELDRCRPPFAIAMLERIKHLFDIDSVVFVVATDTVQLSHSINAIYGSGFDGLGYLGRFFNRAYYFAGSSRSAFVRGLTSDHPISAEKLSLPPEISLEDFLTDGFDYFALSLRDIEQAYDIIRSFVTIWSERCKIELVVLLPVVIAHQQRQSLSFHDFGGALNDIAERNGGTKTVWNATFNSGDFRSGPETVSCVQLANDFAERARHPLSDINHEVTAAYSRWAARRFSDEFALLHGNSFNPRSPPYSIIARYPEMVRSAGRLTTQQH